MSEEERFRKILEEIERFGYNNPGHGWSCAAIVSKAFGHEPKERAHILSRRRV